MKNKTVIRNNEEKKTFIFMFAFFFVSNNCIIPRSAHTLTMQFLIVFSYELAKSYLLHLIKIDSYNERSILLTI